MKTATRIILGLLVALPLAASAQDASLGPGGGPPGGNSWTAAVNVPDNCVVVDTDGSSHAYATGQFLGICALQTAIDAGSVSGVQFSNAFPSFGLFVTTVGGIAADPSSQYWALYQNGSFASLGISQLPVAAGDTIVLELHDFSDNFLGSQLTLNINLLVSKPSAPASPGGSSLTLHAPFDVPQALEYIRSKQRSDGSFGSPLLNDWVAIASAVGGAGDARKNLSEYFIANPPALQSVTDYERHAMALQALGINPYSGTSVDVIAPIVKAFDGVQVGDTSLVNDDIFALFPLTHAGYTASDDIISKTTAFIISRQRTDGSWNGSADMSAAAVQALSLTRSLPGTGDAARKALVYLRGKQESDGGFGNASATSWAMQAIAAAGQSMSDWNAGTYKTPDYYLATKQERDGGVESESAGMETRLWATAYAIPAVERKTWHSLLFSFEKPVHGEAPPSEATATKTQEAATAATTSVIAPAPAEPSNALEALPNVAVKKQEVFAAQAQEIPVIEPAISAEATTTLVHISPPFVQTAAIATVDYGTSIPWKWVLAILLLIAIIAGAALYLGKRRQPRKFGSLTEQKQ